MTFAEILTAAMEKRNWSARHAAKVMSEKGAKATPQSIKGWMAGDSIPNMRYGRTITAAFGLKDKDILDAAAKQAEVR